MKCEEGFDRGRNRGKAVDPQVWTPKLKRYGGFCILGGGGFPGESVVQRLPASAGDAGDVGCIPGWRRSPGERNGNRPQYSCLENPVDRAWWAAVRGIAESNVAEGLSAHAHSLGVTGWRIEVALGLERQIGIG